MAFTAGDIITRAQTLFFDATGVRLTTANALKWVNDAQRAVLDKRPQANTLTVIAQLEAGKVLQTLPAGGRRIVDMPRNLLSVTVPPTPATAGLLVAESNGATGVKIWAVSTSAITLLTSIPYSDARVPASAEWLKFDAVPFGSDWYCVLAGDGVYGGDLFKISAGVATNQSSDLGMTWTGAGYGPNSIVSATAGMVVGMNQAPKYKFSVNGSTWGDGVTLPTPLLNGCILAGSAGKFYDVASSGNAWKSTDGLNYTDTLMPPGAEVNPLGALSFGDGGMLNIGGFGGSAAIFNWMSAAGVEAGSVNLNVGGTYKVALGNASHAFGYTPMWGVFGATNANILVRDNAGQCAVAKGATPAAFATGGGATVSTVGASGSYGYGCYSLGGGNYVVVLDTGIYRTTDFTTFTLAQAPSGIETFIGAGGYNPGTVTPPAGWS